MTFTVLNRKRGACTLCTGLMGYVRGGKVNTEIQQRKTTYVLQIHKNLPVVFLNHINQAKLAPVFLIFLSMILQTFVLLIKSKLYETICNKKSFKLKF